MAFKPQTPTTVTATSSDLRKLSTAEWLVFNIVSGFQLTASYVVEKKQQGLLEAMFTLEYSRLDATRRKEAGAKDRIWTAIITFFETNPNVINDKGYPSIQLFVEWLESIEQPAEA